jgi:hypothetical protein
MSGDWRTPQEAFEEFGFSGSHLMRFRTHNHLALGRRIKFKPANGCFLFWREDLKQIRQAMDNPPSRRFVDPASVKWLQRHLACAPPYSFSFTTLMRWHKGKHGCPFLSVDRVDKLTAKQIPVYRKGGRGFQLQWYFREDQLAEIRSNLDAGRVVSRLHGPGLTQEEAFEQFGVSRYWLDKWAGRGVEELGGVKLRTWHEARFNAECISPVYRKGRVFRVRVYSPEQLKKITEARLTPSRPDRDGLSDRQALEKYPHYIRNGDLATWRELASKKKVCQWIGRPLDCWKDSLTGEWKTSARDVAEIVDAMKAAYGAAGRWIDPDTGEPYLALAPFMVLTRMPEQHVARYREGPKGLRHSALGRGIRWKRVVMPSRRNRHATNYVYSEQDGRRIAEWKNSGKKASAQVENQPANLTIPTPKPSPINPFVPSPLQRAILAALDGKSMTADELESALKVDRSRLYYSGRRGGKGGLSELVKLGRVLSGRGRGIRGYFRPDKPPFE